MTEYILCYIASLLIIIGGFIGILFYAKKALIIKFRILPFLIGLVSSTVYCIVIMMLFQSTFNNINYYNTESFRGFVGTIYILLLCVGRYFIARAVFFSRGRYDQGYSFSMGFGFAPGAFLFIYILIMLLIIVVHGLSTGSAVMEAGGLLTFEDNAQFSVFPAFGHVSFAGMFVAVNFMLVLSGRMLAETCEKTHPPVVSVVWFVLFAVLESFAITPIPYIKFYGLQDWELLLIVAGVCLIYWLMLRFMPLKRKPSDYQKQFE